MDAVIFDDKYKRTEVSCIFRFGGRNYGEVELSKYANKSRHIPQVSVVFVAPQMSCSVRENDVTALIISSVRSRMLRIFNKMQLSLFKCFLCESIFKTRLLLL